MQTEIRYATPNIRVAQLLIDIAEENGIDICPAYKNSIEDKSFHWNVIKFDKQRRKIIGTQTTGGDCTFEEFLKEISTPLTKMRLTDDYEAVVDYSGKIVKVGCQNIPFSKVKELYNLIKK